MRSWLFGTVLLLLVAGGVLAWLGGADGVRVQEGRLTNEAGETLRTRLYFPQSTAGALPGVLLCHGVDNSKEQMDVLARAFAERDFAVLAFDFGGHGESYPRRLRDSANLADARRALAALAVRPEVDRRRLAVVGYSMGAPPAAEAGLEEDGVHAVVALGRAVELPPSCRRNVLLCAGVYDQFQPPAAYRAALGTSTGNADEVSGSFADGTARRLVLSPHTDHPLEPYDPLLAAAAVGWVEEALGLDRSTSPAPRAHLRTAGRAALLASGVILLVALLHLTLSRVPPARLRSAAFRRGVAAVGAATCLVPVALSGAGLGGNLPLGDAGLVTVLALLGVNWLLCRHAETDRLWADAPGLFFRPVLGMAATVAVAWLLALLLLRARELAHTPADLLALPRLALHLTVFYPDVLLHKLHLLLFAEYSTRLVPSPVWYGCLALEVLLPGAALTVAAGTAERGWRFLQGIRSAPEPVSRSTVVVRAALAVGLLATLAASYLRLKPLGGPATRPLAREMAGFLLLFLAVLIVLLLLGRIARGLVRGRARRRQESRCQVCC